MGRLANEIQAGPAPRPKPCIVRRWLDALDDDDRTWFATACDEPNTWGTRALWQRATANGYEGSENRIMVHRNHECSCG